MLFSQGFGSRHECGAVFTGTVALEQQTITDLKMLLDLHEGLLFHVDGQPWSYHAQAYIALHKPAGYECSQKPSHHPSIYTLLPAPLRRRGVQAAGRLDADTTGLLLLSDDGQFIHKAISGKRHLPKTYLVTTKHPVSDTICQQLLRGVQLDDEPAPITAAACELQHEHQLLLPSPPAIPSGQTHDCRSRNRVTELHRLPSDTLNYRRS